ncbi:hypothetical protein K9L97_03990 [Candidatus Woesearchaeota archaeon]|nr:hypothetical protein [Candidatus Woesearchaeota archaeon]
MVDDFSMGFFHVNYLIYLDNVRKLAMNASVVDDFSRRVFESCGFKPVLRGLPDEDYVLDLYLYNKKVESFWENNDSGFFKSAFFEVNRIKSEWYKKAFDFHIEKFVVDLPDFIGRLALDFGFDRVNVEKGHSYMLSKTDSFLSSDSFSLFPYLLEDDLMVWFDNEEDSIFCKNVDSYLGKNRGDFFRDVFSSLPFYVFSFNGFNADLYRSEFIKYFSKSSYRDNVVSIHLVNSYVDDVVNSVRSANFPK